MSWQWIINTMIITINKPIRNISKLITTTTTTTNSITNNNILPSWCYHEQFISSSSTSPCNIAVAMSGGIDSAMTAYILKQRGANVTGIYMCNWDIQDETDVCTSDQDWSDVQTICQHIGIPSKRINFVKEYWGRVFESTLLAYHNGLTPNPDIWCNKEIKFGVLYHHLFTKTYHTSLFNQFDYLATGHYAKRIPWTTNQYHLAEAINKRKDQTYFLAAIQGHTLSKVLFPLGGVSSKCLVKELAKSIGLTHWANKKESMGICFIGKRRRFGEFLDQYMEQRPGHFVLEDGTILAQHDGLAKYTIGQCAKIKSQANKYFVSHKCIQTGNIKVVPGRDHPHLYSTHTRIRWLQWIHSQYEQFVLQDNNISANELGPLTARVRYQAKSVSCQVKFESPGYYHVIFSEPIRAITPGQVLVLYRGNVCLGCGIQESSSS